MGLLQRKTRIILIHLDSLLVVKRGIYIYLPFNIAVNGSTTCLRYQKGQCKPFSPFMLTLKLNCHFFKKILKIKYLLRPGYKICLLPDICRIVIAMYDAYLELVMMFSLNRVLNILTTIWTYWTIIHELTSYSSMGPS